MKYIHIRALGTPRDIRYRRKIDHDIEAFREDYTRYLATQDEAMEALITLALEHACCLLCFEADAKICHRWMVAERAVEMTGGSLEIAHLDAGEFLQPWE